MASVHSTYGEISGHASGNADHDGQSAREHVACRAGHDAVDGIGSPGPGAFSPSGPHLKLNSTGRGVQSASSGCGGRGARRVGACIAAAAGTARAGLRIWRATAKVGQPGLWTKLRMRWAAFSTAMTKHTRSGPRLGKGTPVYLTEIGSI